MFHRTSFFYKFHQNGCQYHPKNSFLTLQCWESLSPSISNWTKASIAAHSRFSCKAKFEFYRSFMSLSSKRLILHKQLPMKYNYLHCSRYLWAMLEHFSLTSTKSSSPGMFWLSWPFWLVLFCYCCYCFCYQSIFYELQAPVCLWVVAHCARLLSSCYCFIVIF